MTCAKRPVRCVLTNPEGEYVIGWNDCRNPQAVCPRAEGEDYTKCRTICDQYGHAEEVAISAARFEGLDMTDGEAFIDGHTYACGPCERALRAIGITTLRFGAERLERYDRQLAAASGAKLVECGGCAPAVVIQGGFDEPPYRATGKFA